MRAFFLAFILFSFISAPEIFPMESAVEEGGAVFESVYISGNNRLFLRGTATYRYLMVIKAYSGALYMKIEDDSEKILEEIPKRLVLEYFHNIKAEDFLKATKEMIRKNFTDSEFEELRDNLKILGKTYRDVNPGDRYSITYFPDTGTELALNGEVLNIFKGGIFAKAMFSIWLGKKPIDKSFRNKILNSSVE